MTTNRRPPGTPTGGQFAPVDHPEASNVELDDAGGRRGDGMTAVKVDGRVLVDWQATIRTHLLVPASVLGCTYTVVAYRKAAS